MWQSHVAEYLEAKARHADAERIMLRAERTFDSLAGRHGDGRAWRISGVALADERCLVACQRERSAWYTLTILLRVEPAHVRLKAVGAIWCAELPAASNDHGGE